MSDDNKLSYFLLGVGIGVTVGLLFAPGTGEETRTKILEKADEGKEFLKRRTSELRESAGDYIEKGKEVIGKQRENLTAAMEAGKQAYRETVGGSAPQEGV